MYEPRIVLILIVMGCLGEEESGVTPYLITPCSVVTEMYFWNYPMSPQTYEMTFDYLTSNSSQLPNQLIYMDVTTFSVWEWDKVLLELAKVKAFVLQNGGKVGGLILKDYGSTPGFIGWRKWQNLPEDYNISVALIGYFDAQVWDDQQCSFNITYPTLHNITNINRWRYYLDRGGAFGYCLIGAILFFSNTIFAGFRLRKNFAVTFELSLSVICLTIETVGNALGTSKYLCYMIDAYSTTFSKSRSIYNDLLVTLTFPFVLTSNLLFLFFWIDITKTSSYLYKGGLLHATKAPAMISIGFVFSLEIIVDVIRFTVPNTGAIVTLLVGLLYAILVMFICSFNGYVLCIVVRKLQSFLNKRQSKNLLRRITLNIVFLFLALCLAATASATDHLPETDLFTSSSIALVVWCNSFNQILIYGRAKEEKSRSHTTTEPNNLTS